MTCCDLRIANSAEPIDPQVSGLGTTDLLHILTGRMDGMHPFARADSIEGKPLRCGMGVGDGSASVSTVNALWGRKRLSC